jgi:hypothetical protein
VLLDYGAMRGIPFICLRTDYGRSLVVSYGIANSGMLLPVTLRSLRVKRNDRYKHLDFNRAADMRQLSLELP